MHGHFFAKFLSSSPTALGPPKSFQEFWNGPFHSPPGQMAAFISVLETQAKDDGTGKNGNKQVDMRSHSMIVAIRYNIGPGGDCARDLWI